MDGWKAYYCNCRQMIDPRDDCAWTATFDPCVHNNYYDGPVTFEDSSTKIVIVTIRVKINAYTCEYSDVYTQ